jgi:hypothetical protein
VAVDYFPVHWVWRLCESGVDEADDLTAELRDKSDAASSRVWRMLTPLAIARRYRLDCGGRIAFRIKAGVILSAFAIASASFETAGRIVIAIGRAASSITRA